MPPFTFYLYVRKKLSRLPEHYSTEEDSVCKEAILDMEEELFNTDESLFRWPVLQLYRNFLIVLLKTFILNPIYRTISFIPVFSAFMLHDCKRMPYKHAYLNHLQWLSSSCLLVVDVCNIPASMSVMTNSMSVLLMEAVVLALQYVEMLMHAIVPSSLVGWKLWEKYLSYKMKKKDV